MFDDPSKDLQNHINAELAELPFNVQFIPFNPRLLQLKLSYGAVVLFGFIEFFSSNGKFFTVSDEKIGEMLCVSERTASRFVKELIDLKLLESSIKSKGLGTYRQLKLVQFQKETLLSLKPHSPPNQVKQSANLGNCSPTGMAEDIEYNINNIYIKKTLQKKVNHDDQLLTRSSPSGESLPVPNLSTKASPLVNTITALAAGCGVEVAIPSHLLIPLAIDYYPADFEQAVKAALSFLVSKNVKSLSYKTLLRFLSDIPKRVSQDAGRLAALEFDRKYGTNSAAPLPPVPTYEQRLARLEEKRRQEQEQTNNTNSHEPFTNLTNQPN